MSSAVNRAGIVILLLFFAPMLTLPAAAREDLPPGYDRLLDLYRDFRALAVPVVRNGVPDYSPAAIQAQGAELEVLRSRLDGIDDSAWPIPARCV